MQLWRPYPKSVSNGECYNGSRVLCTNGDHILSHSAIVRIASHARMSYGIVILTSEQAVDESFNVLKD